MGFNIRHINYNRHLIGVEYGGDYFSPDTVKAEMATVDNLITSLVRDVSDSKAPDSFRKSLADFVLSWRAFRDDNSGWLSRAMNINYAKTLEFKDQTKNWYKKAERDSSVIIKRLLYKLPCVNKRLGTEKNGNTKR